jgi:hypothetical protein
MVHHIVWRSRGGPTDVNNLVTLCARCHGLVHDRWLHVARSAEGTLTFTNRAGQPLRAPHPHVGSAVRITCAAAHVSGATQSSEPRLLETLLDEPLLDEDHIPDVVDGEWWQKHEHLFDWSGGRPS